MKKTELKKERDANGTNVVVGCDCDCRLYFV